ncbi:protein FAM27A/B/C-like isoform X2 [Hylobates moloch]|uniref:protein FAM27A/B/C-like isoform X2 n=1 Tax=Hylobates moloch TaxID=81572 RepID=UPI002674A0DB|nr:protein FAM27A/B/C-like isoform X2 [Hylobates moloch]
MGSTGTSPAARSPKGPTRMMKPQAESGGSSVASKPQACPDGVRDQVDHTPAQDKSRTGAHCPAGEERTHVQDDCTFPRPFSVK